MTDEPMIKLVNGIPTAMSDEEVAEHKAMQEAWLRDEPIRIKMAEPAADAALSNPDLMRLWGEIHAIWDDIEQTLFLAFYALTDDDFGLSRTIFFSQKGHAQRRSMVLEVARSRFFTNEVALKPFETVIRRIAARADARNNLFHGQWGWRNNGTLESTEVVRFVVEPSLSVDNKIYGMSDLVVVRDKMRDTLQELRDTVRPYTELKMAWERQHFFDRRRLG